MQAGEATGPESQRTAPALAGVALYGQCAGRVAGLYAGRAEPGVLNAARAVGLGPRVARTLVRPLVVRARTVNVGAVMMVGARYCSFIRPL